MISIRAFGAAGNGTTDDPPYIQHTLNESGEIYIPDGNYRVTKTLLIHPDTFITAENNARLFMYGDFTTYMPKAASPS